MAIIAILTGLTLPAVQKVREAANRVRCANNLKQIGLAVHNFESATGYLPPSRLACHAGTWMNVLLPYVEQANADALWIAGLSYHYQPDAARAVDVSIYRCPSRRNRGLSLSGDGRRHVPHQPGSTGDYAVVIGDGHLPNGLDHSPPHAQQLGTSVGRGPFVHGWEVCGGSDPDFRNVSRGMGQLWVTFADLSGGTSNTLFIGEKHVDTRRAGHYPDNAIFNGDNVETVGRFAGTSHPLGPGPFRFNSAHSSVLFALGDGSVRPFARTTDPTALASLSVRGA